MKRPIAWSRVAFATSALCLITAPLMRAQTAPAAAPKEEEETIVLSPFVVEATEDQGYAAKETLAGTRVRTELKDVASAISVVTQQFLKDTGSKNSQDLLVYTPNTEVAGLNGNYSGQGGASIYQEALTNPSNTTRVRGLDVADNTRDYFLTDIPWDGFNVGRVDLQRGPNSILFGVGSPAGIINTSLNTAGFKTAYKFENVSSSYGSQRNILDLNQVILPDQLSVRFVALNDNANYQQKPAFNNDTRFYGAFKFDPKIFNSAGSHTSIHGNYENGTVHSNNPRTLPPDDEITPWFATTDGHGNPGLNKLTINEYLPGYGNNSSLVNATYNKGGWAQGRTYWPDPLSYFNGSPSTKPGIMPAVTNGIPTEVISGQINTGWVINSSGVAGGPYNPGNAVGIGGLPDFRPLAVAPYNQYAANSAVPGGSYYADVTLSDPSIFNFFNKLLDGPNKREWQNWNAYNIAISQTFLNDRFGLEYAYDNQDYSSGEVGFLQGSNYAINVDVNQTLADGSPNVNVGRPYVANSAAGGNDSTTIHRDSSRLTGYADLRTEDYFGKSLLTEVLGRHVITGLVDLDHKNSTSVQWSNYGTDLGWESLNNLQLNTKVTNYRQFDWVDYIGPNLGAASSAAGANLNGITNIIAPPASNSVTYFNSHWNKPTDPSTPGYVNPGGAYTYLNSDTGTVVTSTQNNNPANYVGWQQAPVNWLSASNPKDFPALVTGGQALRYRDESKALVWQGYLFDGDLAATYGWREDNIVNYATSAPVDGNTGATALSYGTDPTSRQSISGQSRTWGGVYHLPKSIMSHLPGGTTLSFYYDKSDNFKADAQRTNLAGAKIPNADGNTKDYGVTITTLDDKLTLKIGHYNTVVQDATFNVTNGNSIAGLGGNGYWLWAAPAWGYSYAAAVQYGLDGNFGLAGGPQGNQWNYAYQDLSNAGASAAQLAAVADPAGAGFLATSQAAQEKAIVNAWLALPVSDGFFNYYGINPTINPAQAHSTGKLYNAFVTFPGGGAIGGEQPGAISAVSTVDNVSTGWEYELTAQPIKNWNITLNYTKTQATKTNIDPATVKFMADNLAFFNGVGGQLRLWGVGGSAIGPNWVANVYNPYLVSALAQGQSAPEVAPWRLNLVTTYSFDRGPIKGVFIGGGLRDEAGRIAGYAYNPTTLGLDVTKPFDGPNDTHYDLWLGYNKKFALARKVNWRIQLNLRNVGESTRLVPVRYQPDGTMALSRIQEGMTWALTNSFEF